MYLSSHSAILGEQARYSSLWVCEVSFPFCIDCCLPGEWHLASETRENVMRRGLFGPTCIFERIVAEAVAVMLSNNTLLDLVQDWEGQETESEIFHSFVRMDIWLTGAVHWAEYSIPVMLKTFYQLVELAEWCEMDRES